MVEVMAAAALAEGYQFPVTVASRNYLATVDGRFPRHLFGH
jgi:hypothetical protein